MTTTNSNTQNHRHCPKCQSDNVSLVLDTKVKTKHRGLIGWLWWVFLAIFTCGLILIIPLITNSKTKSKTKTVSLCQNCGHKFKA